MKRTNLLTIVLTIVMMIVGKTIEMDKGGGIYERSVSEESILYTVLGLAGRVWREKGRWREVHVKYSMGKGCPKAKRKWAVKRDKRERERGLLRKTKRELSSWYLNSK